MLGWGRAKMDKNWSKGTDLSKILTKKKLYIL